MHALKTSTFPKALILFSIFRLIDTTAQTCADVPCPSPPNLVVAEGAIQHYRHRQDRNIQWNWNNELRSVQKVF
ncbi:MAG: hypothetical protein ISR78_08390 [Spirochaetia bacterium]|nr:hypothetical protein [Spirochaetia bacterium]